MGSLWGQHRIGGPGTHCSMTLFGSSLVRHGIEELWVPETEAATRTSAHEYCRSGHGTVAKQVRVGSRPPSHGTQQGAGW